MGAFRISEKISVHQIMQISDKLSLKTELFLTVITNLIALQIVLLCTVTMLTSFLF